MSQNALLTPATRRPTTPRLTEATLVEMSTVAVVAHADASTSVTPKRFNP
jgi:hypothetical protein